MSDDRELSRALTTLVAGVAGVVEVYQAVPRLKAAALLQSVPLLQAMPLLQGSPLTPAVDTPAVDTEAKVAVRRDAGVLTVSTTIGVGDGHPVPATVRAVGDALRGYLAALDPATLDPAALPPVITVTVGRVDTRRSSPAASPVLPSTMFYPEAPQ